jgi:DNA-binding LytR/AlgR family response regulator
MNCLLIDQDPATAAKLTALFDKNDGIVLKTHSKNTAEAAQAIAKELPQLIIASADTPGLHTFLSEIPSIPFVLISQDKAKASEAFELGATDYLVHPISKERWQQALQRLKTNKPVGTALDLFVRSEYKIVRIDYQKLLYIEALADYVVFQMQDGHKTTVHTTMKAVEEALPSELFARIHRSYIIHVQKIDLIDNQTVWIADKQIPIGAHYRDAFYKRLNFL